MLMTSRRLATYALIVLAGCSPESCDEFLDLEANSNVIQVRPEQVSILTGESTVVRAETGVPNSRPRVTSRDPSIATAEVTSTGVGGPTPGIADITITGVSEGRTVIEVLGASDPIGTPPKLVDVEVLPVPDFTLELSPPSLDLFMRQTARLTCIVRRNGVPVDEPVRFVSADTEIATVSDDGTVTAIEDGGTTITCSIANGQSIDALVIVRVPPAPSTMNISGSYSLTGKKVSDTCPAGTFEDNISNPGPISVTAGTSGGESFVAIQSNTTISGSYDSITGAFSGTGEITIGSNGEVLRETVNGMWKRNPIRFEGQLIFEFFRGTTLICQVVYDVVYSKM